MSSDSDRAKALEEELKRIQGHPSAKDAEVQGKIDELRDGTIELFEDEDAITAVTRLRELKAGRGPSTPPRPPSALETAETQPSMKAVRQDGPTTIRPEDLRRREGRPQQGRVLVADDDPTIRSILVAELRSEGFAVREAENGLEALNMAIDSPPAPHVILLDLWMPKLSGHAVRAALQIDRPDIQILIISADDYRNLVKQDPTYADEFVFTKPFDLDQLIRVVHERALEAQAMPRK